MEISQLVKTVQPYTMASPERLIWKAETAQRILREGIPGDFVECGVWNGGSAAIQAHYAIPAGRAMHLFDSFEGMPNPSANDVPSVGGVTSQSEIGKCVGSIDKVKEVMNKVGVVDAKHPGMISIHKGWFHDTFQNMPNLKIAMLNLDSDWYESEMLCWKTWYDKVVPGGFIYIDDFYYWPGCQKAAIEFAKTRKEPMSFNRIGHSAWIQKGVPDGV